MPNLISDLKRHEGFRAQPYQCSEGHWTFGYGFTSITEPEAETILKMRVQAISNALEQYTRSLSPARRDVIINMAFNLGLMGVMGFRRMWAAIYRHDFDAAAKEMLDSRWAKQVGGRADELSEIMRNG
jgi:lysozyme